MRAATAIAICAQLGLLAGCANSESIYGNIYEELRAREAMVHPSSEPAGKSMSYQDYDAERKKLLERNVKQ